MLCTRYNNNEKNNNNNNYNGDTDFKLLIACLFAFLLKG